MQEHENMFAALGNNNKRKTSDIDIPDDDTLIINAYQFEMSKEQRRKDKKQKKRALKLDASATLQVNMEHMALKRANQLKLKDIQTLVLWSLADGVSTSWMLIKNKPSLRKVLILHVSALNAERMINLMRQETGGLPFDYDMPMPLPFRVPSGSMLLTSLSQLVTDGVMVQGPGEKYRLHSALGALLQSPLTQVQKLQLRQSRESRKFKTLPEYVLSDALMGQNDYPMLGSTETTDWFHVTEEKVNQHDFVGVDCEMCFASGGLVVTRVTLVSKDCQVLYDELVKPKSQILDYNTRYSGITAAMLENVTLTIDDVFEAITEFIGPQTILIGHSLENDLRALKMVHRRIIDTALMFHSNRGPPSKPSLRFLAQKYLDTVIQQGTDGHDSVIDASTCVKLALLKLERGYAHGLVINESESLFSRLVRNNRSCAYIDQRSNLVNYGEDATQVSVNSDDETIDNIVPMLRQHDFVVGRLKLDTFEDDPLANLGPLLARLHSQNLPSNTMIIIASGQGDTSRTSELLTKRQEYNELITMHSVGKVHLKMPDKVFSAKDVELLENEIRKARCGVALFGVVQ